MANFKFSEEFLAELKNKEKVAENDVESYQIIGRNVYVATFNVTYHNVKMEVTYSKKSLEALEVAIHNFLSH